MLTISPPKLRAVRFSDGANGYRLQEYRNDDAGITVTSEKADSKSSFVDTWTMDTLPGLTFRTYRELYYAFKNGGKPCNHEGAVHRKRLNADCNGVAFEYKHCEQCGHNEFIEGRRSAFDAVDKAGMLN